MGRILQFFLYTTFLMFTSSPTAREIHDVYTPASQQVQPYVETLSIQSKYLKAARHLDISLPAAYVESGVRQKYPLIIVLDGELLFYPLAGLVQFQGMNSQMPEAIVVGIKNLPGTRRDLTPTPINSQGQPLWFGGKQDQYLAFIEREVIPLIESKYYVANFRVLFGLSPSGQFALHTFWKKPGLFDAHIALNTADFNAVGYGDESVFDKIIKSINGQPNLSGNLYVSMPKAGGGSNPRVLAGYEKLADAFESTSNKNIKYRRDLIEQTGYAAVLPAAISALAFVFPPEKWDPNYRQFLSEIPGQTLTNIKLYFAKLSQEYGFEAIPRGERYYNRNRLKRIGYVLLQQGRLDESIGIFEYWASLYPNAANAYDSLADAYAAKGKTKMELQLRRKAYKLAKQNGDARAASFEPVH